MADKLYFSTKAVIVNDEKVLVLYDMINGKPYYDLPGGRMIIGEQAEATLKREVYEETGLSLTTARLIDTWHHTRDEAFHIVGVFYQCTVVDDDIVISEEHKGYKWMSVEEFMSLQVPSFRDRIMDWKVENFEFYKENIIRF